MPIETAVKEPQATPADATEDDAAAEARRLAEWHRRFALAAATEERRQRRVWEDVLALAKRLKATQEAEKEAQEAEAERHKRDVAHQWRCISKMHAAEQKERARLRTEAEKARATRAEGAAGGLAVISSDEEEAECPPAPKAVRVQSPEEEWQERLRRAEVEEEELWQPPPEDVESEEEPRPQAPPSPGAEEEPLQSRPPDDNARGQGDQQPRQQPQQQRQQQQHQQQQQQWHGPQGAAIGPFVSQEVRSAVRDGMLWHVQTLHISWASGPAPQQPEQESGEARLWEEAPRASDERDPRRRARPQGSTGPAAAPTAEEGETEGTANATASLSAEGPAAVPVVEAATDGEAGDGAGATAEAEKDEAAERHSPEPWERGPHGGGPSTARSGRPSSRAPSRG
ncbi:GL15192 [Drosophila persimilis]|uniref:GL15192 n=1 Tax=Drosophila persimilis TaxID=7234 RepID=B4H3K9_DROPE|nr:GL15192 [Drosophila persimilis]